MSGLEQHLIQCSVKFCNMISPAFVRCSIDGHDGCTTSSVNHDRTQHMKILQMIVSIQTDPLEDSYLVREVLEQRQDAIVVVRSPRSHHGEIAFLAAMLRR